MEEIKENIETQESQEMQENGMPKVESTFEELGVSGEILRAIREMGYETPMPVQEKGSPHRIWFFPVIILLRKTERFWRKG